jgi:short-subunit dehydrogenase
MGSLDGKVAVITGASSGIGAALAGVLAREGSRVAIAARRKDRLDEVATRIAAAGGTAVAIQCDITDRRAAEDLIRSVAERFGRIDILVNNAGRGHFSDVQGTSDETLEEMFRVNVFSLWYTVRPVLVVMKAQGSGHIINIASIAGKIAFPYNSAYVAAKHAVVGFTHALRLELMETNIHASVVCPAGVLTEWASLTEGGSMLELFHQAGPRIKQIAAERGLPLAPVEGVIHAERVAETILGCIRTPVAEVYTHAGSREFVLLSTEQREKAEAYQRAAVLGEREAYLRLKGA